MEKSEKQALVEAWERSHKIIRDIRNLAEQNTFLAYGVIRQAETIVDIIMVRKAHEANKQIKEKPAP